MLLLGEHVTGRLPNWAYVKAALASTWPMVSASYLPLLALVLARLTGASLPAAASVGLAAAIVLLTFHGWSAGRAAQLRGWQLSVTIYCGCPGTGNDRAQRPGHPSPSLN